LTACFIPKLSFIIFGFSQGKISETWQFSAGLQNEAGALTHLAVLSALPRGRCFDVGEERQGGEGKREAPPISAGEGERGGERAR